MVEPSFQGVNRLFVLTFENDAQRASHTGPYLPTVQLKKYNIMINGKNFFDKPVQNYKVTYQNIIKICPGHRDDYAASCLLDYPYF